MAPAKKSQSRKGAPPVPSAKAVVPKKKRKPYAEDKADRKAAAAQAREMRRTLWHQKQKEAQSAVQRAVEAAPDIPLKKPGHKEVDVKYTPALARTIKGLIVCGTSLEKISKREGMPELWQMLYWLGDDEHPFQKDYARGKELMVPFYEEKAVDAANDIREAEIVIERDGSEGSYKEVRRTDAIERSKLSYDAYKWALSHLKPKKHGRNAEVGNIGPNEQLEGLFAALKQGPAK